MKLSEALKNSQGSIWYGMHFYPGVAEYKEPGQDPYRVYLNEDTIRAMDPTFAGKPIFVEHVDAVESNLDELRKEVDGWVIESFFNESDGKHWVKFIICSERGNQAIQKGMRLSNAYFPKATITGGLWNGVSYLKEITSAEYQHLAIVKHPRYQESVILSPEKFKTYNETNKLELKRIANSETKGDLEMFNFFKKSKVENAIDPELSVILPKSGKEMTLTAVINAMDEMASMKEKQMADPTHNVKLYDGSMCNVGDLVEKHRAMNEELATLKKKKEDSVESEDDVSTESTDVDVEGDKANEEEEKKKALDVEAKDKELADAKKKNEADVAALKKAQDKEKAQALKNAHLKAYDKIQAEELKISSDRVAQGKMKYGS